MSLLSSTPGGNVYAIIGGASGMGAATVEILLKQGHKVAVADLNASLLKQFIEGLQLSEKESENRLLIQTINITDRNSVSGFFNKTLEKFGRIDGIANYAGTAGHKLGHELIHETSDEEYAFIMDVNVKGVFNTLAEALKPGILREGNHENNTMSKSGGSFVHVGSMFSERGFAKGALYSASKHAGVGMVKSAAIEAGKRGIRVNLVMPGPIDTPMLRANEESGAEGTAPQVPLGRLGQSEEVANVVVFLLSDSASYVTGATWGVDGGANA